MLTLFVVTSALAVFFAIMWGHEFQLTRMLNSELEHADNEVRVLREQVHAQRHRLQARAGQPFEA